jgi:hypothetical protein
VRLGNMRVSSSTTPMPAGHPVPPTPRSGPWTSLGPDRILPVVEANFTPSGAFSRGRCGGPYPRPLSQFWERGDGCARDSQSPCDSPISTLRRGLWAKERKRLTEIPDEVSPPPILGEGPGEGACSRLVARVRDARPAGPRPGGSLPGLGAVGRGSISSYGAPARPTRQWGTRPNPASRFSVPTMPRTPAAGISAPPP